PLLSVVMSADGSVRGGFEYPESAARALSLAAQRAAWLRRPTGMTPEVAVERGRARAIVDGAAEGWLPPEAAHALLDAYGIPLVGERHAPTPEAAVAAAKELGLPVVVKTAVAGAAHARPTALPSSTCCTVSPSSPSISRRSRSSTSIRCSRPPPRASRSTREYASLERQ